ncbi:hypothetical protein RM190_00500 [Paracoccus sp. CPCC 101403]|uniref:Ribbon-helix-helix protein, CopG family n=2 Tax=Paracoccus broussonetiae TaxID=3075834 RepID=A0ABU3E7X4_9RHOB|nr:hypothetical protein [Paracoccus sp. CPCC 101403]MDT1060312.1 hypothetical protein [Paracoccus sp. CPCC 101403]
MDKRVQIAISVKPDVLSALEAWRQTQPGDMSRARAAEALLRIALQSEGRLDNPAS